MAAFPLLAELVADWSGLVVAAPGFAEAEAPAPGVLVAAISPLALGAVLVAPALLAAALLSGVLGDALLALSGACIAVGAIGLVLDTRMPVPGITVPLSESEVPTVRTD